MVEDAAVVEGVDGTVVAYQERLHAPWYVWGLATFLTASLGVAYGFYLGDLAGLLTFLATEALVAWWLLATAARVVVDDRVLRAGRARLPLQHRRPALRRPKDPCAARALAAGKPRCAGVGRTHQRSGSD